MHQDYSASKPVRYDMQTVDNTAPQSNMKQPATYQSYSPHARQRGYQHQQNPSDYSMQRGDTPERKENLHSPIRQDLRKSGINATPTQKPEAYQRQEI